MSETDTEAQAAPRPPDELHRLAALHRLNQLDTAPELAFDRITRLAARVFAVQVAVVAFVDRERNWFKSAIGLDLCEVPRDQALCAHTILSDEALVVPDCTRDPRFAGNPLVTGPAGARFYAGQPVHSPDGHRVGTLCLIDRAPRADLDRADRASLRDLAGLVEDELAAQAAHARALDAKAARARDRAARLQATVDAAPVALIALDPDDCVTAWNRAAERIFGWPAETVLGKPLPLRALPGTPDVWPDLLGRLAAGARVADVPAVPPGADGQPVPVRLSGAPLPDGAGGPAGAVLLAQPRTPDGSD